MQEKRHDTYKDDKKWPEPTICTDCSAVFSDGRWSWSTAPEQANKVRCPACQRITQNYPAGHLELKGPFFEKHRDEILNLINNEARLEKNEHPLERIIDISEEKACTAITTTGVHIARRIGEAVSRSYKGDFSLSYGDGEKTIRISWER